ncbi:HAUS augmin-like complex subunit 1 [Xenia sp. Carnegie-2017]|uniref:HAUS augmin-like complex subunit 1 n=1 Tax=Xenia sp. Carnegie-2017 TaxID=2897299 RepID=UPI001F036E9C|nr:HAUS augmin-like complex subunit 1 [Xenia sp. Carnegie-2017]
MDEKHLKVRSWLESVYQGNVIPPFEVNSTTVSLLYDLACINERKDKAFETIMEELIQRKEEYKHESARLHKITAAVGLSNLPESSQASVEILANTALNLNLKDTTMSSYILGINNLLRERHLIKKQMKESKYSMKKLLRATKKALLQYNTLKRAYEILENEISLQEPLLKQRRNETDFLKQKSSEYEQQLHHLQSILINVNLKPDLFHKALERKYEDILKVEDELKPLKTKLDNYHSLPPNMSLAKVKLEEARIELETLEEQLTKDIEQIHNA